MASLFNCGPTHPVTAAFGAAIGDPDAIGETLAAVDCLPAGPQKRRLLGTLMHVLPAHARGRGLSNRRYCLTGGHSHIRGEGDFMPGQVTVSEFRGPYRQVERRVDARRGVRVGRAPSSRGNEGDREGCHRRRHAATPAAICGMSAIDMSEPLLD